MLCHICQREAIERCFTCGELFCEQHGSVNCARCETGVMAGDNRPDRITTKRLPETTANPWWRPREAPDFDPPACNTCQGLARYTCNQCGGKYCSEHAGRKGECGRCLKDRKNSNRFLLCVFAVVTLVLVVVMMLGK